MATSKLALTYLDYDDESSVVQVNGAEVTDLLVGSPLWDALQTAINNVQIGTLAKVQRSSSVAQLSITPPADENAQRERKWLVIGHDAVDFSAYRFEIPCAKVTLLYGTGAKGEMDQTSAEYIALKAAVEAYAVSTHGNAVVVDKAVLVGRNI